MADSYLPYQDPATVSRKLDSESITVGANTVERERIQISGKTDTGISEVLGEAPSSGSLGLVVRNIPSGSQAIYGTSNIATGSIQLDPLSHVTVQNIKGGTLTTLSSLTTGSVQLDPLSHVTVTNLKSGTLTTVSNIVTGSIQLDPLSYLNGINNTVKISGDITIGDITGGTIDNIVTGSIQLDPRSWLAGITDTIKTTASMTMGNIPGGTLNVIVAVTDITNTVKTTASMTMSSIPGGTIDVVSKITNGSIQLDPLSHVTVTNIKQGTLTTVGTVSAITTGSIQLDPLSHVTVSNLKQGTLTTLSNLTSGSIQILNISTLQGVTNTVRTAAYLYGNTAKEGTGNEYRVLVDGDGKLQVDAGITMGSILGGTIDVVSKITTGSIQLDPLSHVTVTNLKQGTLTTLSSLTAGSVQLTTSGALIGTVSIVPTLMYSVTGATVGAGTTHIQAAVASKKIKVYAYDLTTTGNTYFEANFVDGYTGGTKLIGHGLVSATLNVVSGIAKSVTPPAYLFATAAGNSLTLISSSAQPLNYNVSYWTADAV